MNSLKLVALFASLALVASTTIPLHRLPRQIPEYSKRDGNSITLGGSIATLGEFYATITLGTPPQTLNVQMDTGSSDLLVFGRLCTDCQSNQTYGAIYSTSYHAVPCSVNGTGYTCKTCGNFLNDTNVCSFSDYYGDGSGVQGPVLTDDLSFGQWNNVNVSFGYIMDASQGFERAPVDGIWGISYADLGITTPALFSFFEQTGTYQGFSMCLQSPTSNTPSSMTFGKPDGDFQYTPITEEMYYNVEITDIQVAGKSLGLSQGTYNSPFTIVDSGTTLLVVPDQVFSGIYNALNNMCDTVSLPGVCGIPEDQSLFNGSCYAMADSDVANFPTIGISLQGIKNPLPVAPSQYLIKLEDNGQTAYCLGIDDGGSNLPTILGDVFMEGFNVFFDIQNSQVGFADVSSCPSGDDL